MGVLSNLTGWHAIIILAIVLLLFGATKLPALAKSVGQSAKIFKSEMRDASAPAPDTTGSITPAAAAPAPAAPASTMAATPVAAGTPLAASPSADGR
jgi:sec-independent protein translocase protein TatA